MAEVNLKNSMLSEYFKINESTGTKGSIAQQLLYQEFPQHFTWDSKARK
jgi:hypothetical protein